ncbi:membrane protein DedA with SNARE-associated domain [Pseudonocardia parietis]|uniref:Membrane protein DedA with SNARE-associated domain n=1 Tax=Pseudonocardia parietis TaxID=570936 RepID=A0ABS4VT36_9PSEU|nr:membrane protein DedA with SNARE-associated domain [Pseudonocardia parietis]
MPYLRFTVTTAAAGPLWSGLWLRGGAALGHTLIAAGT